MPTQECSINFYNGLLVFGPLVGDRQWTSLFSTLLFNNASKTSKDYDLLHQSTVLQPLAAEIASTK